MLLLRITVVSLALLHLHTITYEVSGGPGVRRSRPRLALFENIQIQKQTTYPLKKMKTSLL